MIDWLTFLREFSKELIKSDDIKLQLDENTIKKQWLGYDGATEEQIIKVENRLQKKLPESYRNFLKVSNGWYNIGYFIYNLLPVEEIDWLKKKHKDFVDLYSNDFSDIDCTDEEYFVYGKDQKSTDFRARYLIKTLTISDWGDSAIILLNPSIIHNGEWEAWFFANWYPGAHQYISFQDLMIEERNSFIELLKDEPKDKKDKINDLLERLKNIDKLEKEYKDICFDDEKEKIKKLLD